MGAKVYMETWVKVKENWRDNVISSAPEGTMSDDFFPSPYCGSGFSCSVSRSPLCGRKFKESAGGNSFPYAADGEGSPVGDIIRWGKLADNGFHPRQGYDEQ